MSTVFAKPLNNATTTLGSAYSSGAGSVRVATGDGALFGTVSPSAPVRFTLVRAAAVGAAGQVLDRTALAIYEATGRTGDTLTGVTVQEGTTDQAFAVGDLIAVLVTAGTIGDLQTAVNAAEANIAARLVAASNLSDLASAATARTNLGLGTAATHPATDFQAAGSYLTANQAIALSGDATGTGATSIVVAIGAGKVTNAMLAGSIAFAKLVGSDITLAESQVTGLVSDLALKAPLASPALTGTPTAPTATVGTNTTQIATTAFVLANAGGGSGTPGGSTTQVQFNSSGAFAGDSQFTWDAAAHKLSLPYITTAGTQLVLEQTGDGYGTSRLSLVNRIGSNGALFENAGLDLVDFGLKSSTAQMNLRFEHRTAQLLDAANTTGELQIVTSPTGTPAFPWAIGAAKQVLYGVAYAWPATQGGVSTYLKNDGSGNLSWSAVSGGGTGTVTTVSVASANGFGGTVASATTTPAITITTSVTGLLKGNGTAISAATAGTDYVIPSGSITGTAANVTGTVAIANGGTGQTSATAAYNALCVTTTLGDLAVRDTSGNVRLAGNTAATKQFLTQTGTGSVSALPAWSTIAAADVPVFVASGASHAAGAVPDPGASAGTTRFLREDATWAAPAGSGTVTSTSVVTANGFAGTVATATTTPAITITTSVTGVVKGNGTALSAATEGTDFLSGASNKLPLPFTFGGSGVPTVANDVTPWLYVGLAATGTRLTLTCKVAPTGSFQVTVKRSSDSGSTFPDTIATVTVSSGNRSATTTTFTNSALAAGDLLRCDVISVNGADTWTARLSTLSRNQ